MSEGTNKTPGARPSRKLTPAMRELAQQLAVSASAANAGINTLPAQLYLDDDRFRREQAQLFRRMPVPIAPSALVPRPGQYVTHDGYGIPLVLTRDKNGKAGVYANVCRHRGTRLVESASVCNASSIVCPYHAWTYNLDGSLRGLPRPDCFPGLNKNDYGLKAMTTEEAGGMIWTQLDGNRFDIAEFLGTLQDDFDTVGMAGNHLYRRNTHTVNANWKLIMDAFLESYHVQRLHKSSIAPFFADAITASSRAGIHFRSAVARVDYQQATGSDEFQSAREFITYSYSVLPGLVIVVSPDYINVMQLYPQATDATRVEDIMLIAEPPTDANAEAHWARSFELLDGGVFAGEDFHAAELGQQGLKSGTIQELTLGSAEAGVAEFHAELQRLLDSAAP